MLLEYIKSYISFRSGPNPHKNLICSAEYLDMDVAASGDLLALDALPRRLLLVIFVGFLGAPLGFGLVGGTGLGLGLPLPRLKSSSLGEASSASHLSAWPPPRAFSLVIHFQLRPPGRRRHRCTCGRPDAASQGAGGVGGKGRELIFWIDQCAYMIVHDRTL